MLGWIFTKSAYDQRYIGLGMIKISIWVYVEPAWSRDSCRECLGKAVQKAVQCLVGRVYQHSGPAREFIYTCMMPSSVGGPRETGFQLSLVSRRARTQPRSLSCAGRARAWAEKSIILGVLKTMPILDISDYNEGALTPSSPSPPHTNYCPGRSASCCGFPISYQNSASRRCNVNLDLD